MNPLIEIYCDRCGSLLARLDGRAELKCRKCGRVAIYESEKTLKDGGFQQAERKCSVCGREADKRRKELTWNSGNF